MTPNILSATALVGHLPFVSVQQHRLVDAGDEKTNFALELTYNYGKDGPGAYNIGNPLSEHNEMSRMAYHLQEWSSK